MAENNGFDENVKKNGNFICGVVEGFYGRPWTTEQRKDLFQKLKKWGMDSYVYAPKDDYKHRAYWRELYTVEEAEHLTGLINAAKEQGIVFYYALSPGLDITYSSQKEITALKRKLEQVSQFGCVAFALLFDDIEPEMSEVDKEVFQSFAHAQVSVTNEMYQHLGQPKFLLCPTQYCSTRAVPNVTNSEYLNTLGSKLTQEIDIMWTGTKVITRTLTIESIQEITDVLRRRPVIWDNLHANDYDQKRVFLGPYSGRSTDLIPKLRGVLTNPNCEYGANFVAIHTLAQWSRCSCDGRTDMAGSIAESVSADIKLETEDGLSGDGIPMALPPDTYHPRRALKNAILEWLPEFYKHKAAWGPMAKPQPILSTIVAAAVPVVPLIPSINTCISLTTTTTSSTSVAMPTLPTLTSTVNTTQLQALAEVCSNVTGSEPFINPTPVMNSLVSESKVICNESIPNPIPISSAAAAVILPITQAAAAAVAARKLDGDTELDKSLDSAMNGRDKSETGGEPMAVVMDEEKEKDVENLEPMDCVTTSPSDEETFKQSTNGSGNLMQVESDCDISDKKLRDLTVEDLSLLCDLFYLPFEHGTQALQILQEFNWLKANAYVIINHNHTQTMHGDDSCSSTCTKPEVEEWFARAHKMQEMTDALNRLAEHLAYCNNRELLYDLYAYVWDMRGVVGMLNSYVKWLALGKFPTAMPSYTQGTYTWFSKGWKETFMSGDQEPWVFRGGLNSDLQRLIPVDSGNDLFVYKAPDVPTTKFYTIRPYHTSDESAVYKVCTKAFLKGIESTASCPVNIIADEHVNVIGDRFIGPYLSFSPEFCMVVEDDEGVIVGYVCAALDAKKFYTKQMVAWLPEMCSKYPQQNDCGHLPGYVTDIINFFHTKQENLEEQPVFLQQYPSSIVCELLPDVIDASIPKRLITCILAALRANGSFGVYATVPANMPRASPAATFYSRLGFIELNPETKGVTEPIPAQILYYGRIY